MTTFLQILMCLFAFVMNEPCPKLPVDDTDLAAVLIEVPVLNQYPALPTGCEATAATMVLQYFHEDIDHVTFASEWLNCEPVYDMEGLLYGPHPQQAFVGDPFSEYGLGCYAGAIEQAIQEHSVLCDATAIFDVSLESLASQYIDQGIPVVIWATLELQSPEMGSSWLVEDGSLFTWQSREHCLVLVGYNDWYYFVNDPQTGTCVQYPKFWFETRYHQMGAQAVVIEPVN